MTDTTFVQTTKAQAAEITGIAPERIGRVNLEMSVLGRQGLLINLEISGGSIFSKTADWSELGITADDIRRTRLTRGQKHLIPMEIIKRRRATESRARQLLSDLSFDVTGFRPYRWLPFTAYDTFKEKWAAILEEDRAIKEYIVTNYDELRAGCIADFREVAYSSWRDVEASGNPEMSAGGFTYHDREQFADAVVAAALAKFPSLDRVERDMQMDYRTALVYGMKDLAREQAEAELIHAQAQAQENEAYLQATLLENQVRHERRMNDLEEEEKAIKIEAMMAAEAGRSREFLGQIRSPFEEVFTALRQQMADAAVDMLESIQKNNHVRGKIAEKGRGLMELFELMAVQDDHELLSRLTALKAAIGPVGDDRPVDMPERSTEEVVSALQSIRDLVQKSVADLTAGPSRFSMIE